MYPAAVYLGLGGGCLAAPDPFIQPVLEIVDLSFSALMFSDLSAEKVRFGRQVRHDQVGNKY
jgi:hypothetical protein